MVIPEIAVKDCRDNVVSFLTVDTHNAMIVSDGKDDHVLIVDFEDGARQRHRIVDNDEYRRVIKYINTQQNMEERK